MTAPFTHLLTQLRGTHRRRGERGAAAVWTLITTTTAFVALVGIVGGGGELVNEQSNARRVAEQAARAGADELSEASARSGGDNVNTGDAIARAHQILRAAGWSGSVRVKGSTVIVTAAGTRNPTFLPLLGVETVHIRETGTADAISSPGG
jgi:Flp pilus assembly protein TadG